ncbi:hypothetical protein HBB16_05985 [Pseudonocardia sp. MCCB 268]|nr:hypothetical protein [Pseudonocardia cytotoxica]
MPGVCHLDTCPVSVAAETELRKKFDSKAEYVVSFMRFVAECGSTWRSLASARSTRPSARADILDVDAAAAALEVEAPEPGPDLRGRRSRRRGAAQADPRAGPRLRWGAGQHHDQLAGRAAQRRPGHPWTIPVRNVNYTVGTMLGSERARIHGGGACPTTRSTSTLTGSAGRHRQRSCRRASPLRRSATPATTSAEDLSGGRLTVRADRGPFPAENVIAGNVIGYGAAPPGMYIRGVVGERFTVGTRARWPSSGVGDTAAVHDRQPRWSSSAGPGATSRPACPAGWRTCWT